jgi:hypothetical protein
VGSIGTAGGNLIVQGNPLTGKTGIKFGGAEWIPQDTGANSDGGVDLGGSSYRFKDLYLSGGVYLGGTGVDNKLDDYESGSWTPALQAGSGSFGSITYTIQRGRYVKTGSHVWMGFEITVNTFSIGTATSYVNLTGFPFSRPELEDQYGSGVVTQRSGWTTNAPTVLPRSGLANSILRYPSSNTAVANMPPANITAGCTMNGFIIIATA